jgi:hypothetical protein
LQQKTLFIFTETMKPGERKCDPIADPDRGSISQQAVNDPEARSGLQKGGQAKIIRAVGAPSLYFPKCPRSAIFCGRE